MKGAEFVIVASSLLIPEQNRGQLREAWLADLQHCASANLAPRQIAFGAALTALSWHNLRARRSSAPDPRRARMKEYYKTQARIVLWWVWTFGAAAMFLAGLQTFPAQNGSGPYLGTPGIGFVPLGPVAVAVATAAALLGIIAIVLEHRQLTRQLLAARDAEQATPSA